jgi:hypothetical protein
VAAVGFEVFLEGTMTSPAAPGHIPAGATPEGDGIVVGHGPVRVDAFIDFLPVLPPV